MCGIFALLNNEQTFSHDEIFKEFMKGKSRGPDNSVIWKERVGFLFGFHRLSINGLDNKSNQPFEINNIVMICNGEIYNYKELFKMMDITPETNSDCEIIIHLYLKYGIEQTLKMLDGVFAFILIDLRVENPECLCYVARDPYGVRPLYLLSNGNKDSFIGMASEIKSLSHFHNECNRELGNTTHTIQHFPPGHYSVYSQSYKVMSKWNLQEQNRYHTTGFHSILNDNVPIFNNKQAIYSAIQYFLKSAVHKRCANTDRQVGCLLSGGLDSSIVCALANEYFKMNNYPKLRTFSIGLEGSEDLIMAKKVAEYIGSDHTQVIVTEKDFTDNIENVIRAVETYDTTTIRASIGNYLIGKYISENTDITVVLNGDGADELCGGYLYMHETPDNITYDHETHKLLNQIHAFDVLRSDKCISSHGLEPRTPFLDREWTQFYLSIPLHIRNHCNDKNIEKYLIRWAFSKTDLLPDKILLRQKEAFSDGVSKQKKSLFKILQSHITNIDFSYKPSNHHFLPETLEQKYYKSVFDNLYPNCDNIIPRYWMPNFIEASDPSARTLELYSNK